MNFMLRFIYIYTAVRTKWYVYQQACKKSYICQCILCFSNEALFQYSRSKHAFLKDATFSQFQKANRKTFWILLVIFLLCKIMLSYSFHPLRLLKVHSRIHNGAASRKFWVLSACEKFQSKQYQQNHPDEVFTVVNTDNTNFWYDTLL